jgi:hypothetical protein
VVKNAHATQSGVIHFVSEMWVGTSKVRERRLGDPGVESPGEGVIRAKDEDGCHTRVEQLVKMVSTRREGGQQRGKRSPRAGQSRCDP